jgi:hypothetical protein
MRLPLLAVLGVATTLGIMTFDATGASARPGDATVVSGARGTAIVKRPLSTSTVVVKRPLRSAMVVKRPLGARGAVVVKRPLRRSTIITRHY